MPTVLLAKNARYCASASLMTFMRRRQFKIRPSINCEGAILPPSMQMKTEKSRRLRAQ
jgi:hypothetical protein